MFNKIALLLNKGEYPEISFSVYVDSIYSVYEYGGYPSGFYLGYPLQKIASQRGEQANNFFFGQENVPFESLIVYRTDMVGKKWELPYYNSANGWTLYKQYKTQDYFVRQVDKGSTITYVIKGVGNRLGGGRILFILSSPIVANLFRQGRLAFYV